MCAFKHKLIFWKAPSADKKGDMFPLSVSGHVCFAQTYVSNTVVVLIPWWLTVLIKQSKHDVNHVIAQVHCCNRLSNVFQRICKQTAPCTRRVHRPTTNSHIHMHMYKRHLWCVTQVASPNTHIPAYSYINVHELHGTRITRGSILSCVYDTFASVYII